MMMNTLSKEGERLFPAHFLLPERVTRAASPTSVVVEVFLKKFA
jgi:hypothetical protein